MSRNHTKLPAAHHDGDALTALLATEHTLREQLDAANAEAERIVSEARARTAAATADLDAATARQLAALDTAHERALQSELTTILAQAEADCARFDDLPNEFLDDLAARLAKRVLEE